MDWHLVAPFATAACVAAAATPILRIIASRVGIVARPQADRWAAQPIPLLGGAALWAGTTLACIVYAPVEAVAPALIAGSSMFVLGLVDDFIHLRPSAKLTGQIVIGCAVAALGPDLSLFTSQAMNAFATILWVVAIANAFNLVDNMDGFCAGIGAIAALALMVIARTANPAAAIAGAALAGASAGFLVFNFKPASIFMGDSGSLFIGSTLAVLTTALPHDRRVASISAPILLLLVPIFDTVFVTVSRKLSARAASVGGRDHTSHRLVAMGFSERQAVLLLYGLGVIAGLTAIATRRGAATETNILLAALVLATVLLGVQLSRVNVYGGDHLSALRDKPYSPLLVDVTYRGRVFEIVLDISLMTLCYYSAYVIRFDREFGSYYHLFVRSLPIVIACQLLSFFAAGVYQGVWQYFGAGDILVFVKAVAGGSLTSVMAIVYFYRFEGYSRGVFVIDAMALGLAAIGSRAFFRVIGELANRSGQRGRRALIYGAGDGGALLVRELRNNARHDYQPIAFIDDDVTKQSKRILGLLVLCGISGLARVIAERRIDAVIVSSDKIEPDRGAALRAICYDSGTALFHLDFRLQPVALARSSLP